MGGLLCARVRNAMTGELIHELVTDRAGIPTTFSDDGRWMISHGMGYSGIWDFRQDPPTHRRFYDFLSLDVSRPSTRLRISWTSDAVLQPRKPDQVALTRSFTGSDTRTPTAASAEAGRLIFIADIRRNVITYVLRA